MQKLCCSVMAGLIPAIPVFLHSRKAWIAGSRRFAAVR
jgi:hypothetical protein